jgi:hypothetical protein
LPLNPEKNYGNEQTHVCEIYFSIFMTFWIPLKAFCMEWEVVVLRSSVKAIQRSKAPLISTSVFWWNWGTTNLYISYEVRQADYDYCPPVSNIPLSHLPIIKLKTLLIRDRLGLILVKDEVNDWV